MIFPDSKLTQPALAFFYGGLVPFKNVLNTMMMSLASPGVVGVLWVMFVYSLAFGGGEVGDGKILVHFPAELLIDKMP